MGKQEHLRTEDLGPPGKGNGPPKATNLRTRFLRGWGHQLTTWLSRQETAAWNECSLFCAFLGLSLWTCSLDLDLPSFRKPSQIPQGWVRTLNSEPLRCVLTIGVFTLSYDWMPGLLHPVHFIWSKPHLFYNTSMCPHQAQHLVHGKFSKTGLST